MKTLEKAFADYILAEKLFTKQDRLLLAVSGGLDSIVCAALLRANGFSVEWAHMNFQLRGEESTRDEDFVRRLSADWDLPLHIAHRNTVALAAERKLSIQETARQLRYEWFEELRLHHFDRIVTAHHADDHAETFLLQLMRGTGISGLAGIPLKRGPIVRPLLFASRAELQAYATAKGLSWVEDSSNEKIDYSRNRLRHQLLPLMETAFPGVAKQVAASATHVREQQFWYEEAIHRQLKKMRVVESEKEKMPALLLAKTPGAKTLFFEWLYQKGFQPGEIDTAWKLVSSQTGAYVDANGYRLLRNRNWLELERLSMTVGSIGLIETGTGSMQHDQYKLSWRLQAYRGEAIPTSPNTAWLDSRHIEFPILVRRWKTGDYFYPLGMPSKKKIARFMTDLRLSRTEKDQAYVLASAKKILWLAGRRIDHRFRVTASTKEVLVLEWINTAH